MSDDLSRPAVEAVDRARMLSDILDQPAQLADALQRAETAAIPTVHAAGGLAVCAMGGSAIGGDLAAAAIGPRARRPIRVIRRYAPEPWADADTLYVCASYSGDTEETLSCFEAVGRLGAPRVAITTGGRLAKAARAEGVPVIFLPSGFQPRAAVVYTTVAVLECAAACGVAPSMREEVEAAASLLGGLAAEWAPESSAGSKAKSLARRLHGRVPVVYGAEATAPVALRWKNQLNENAKVPAFSAELPEADHNELCGYERAHAFAALHPVLLEEPSQRAQIRRRIGLTAEMAGDMGAAGVDRVSARGETLFERVMSLVLLGDLVSMYLAVLEEVDPTPVEALVLLKYRMRPTAP